MTLSDVGPPAGEHVCITLPNSDNPASHTAFARQDRIRLDIGMKSNGASGPGSTTGSREPARIVSAAAD